MGFLDAIKFKLGIKLKEIDKPVNEMTMDEKGISIYAILQTLKNSKEIPNKIYEILDSIDDDMKEFISRNLIHTMEYKFKLPEDIKDELGQNLVERYFSYNSKKYYLYNNIYFREFSVKKEGLFKSIKQYLTASEVRALLNSSNIGWHLSDECKIEILREAIELGIDLSDDEMRLLYNSSYKEKFIDYFNELPLNKKMNYAKDNIAMAELDELLSPLEKIILKIEKGYYTFEDNEKIEIESFINILKTYENISEYGLNAYVSEFYDLKEIKEIINLIKFNEFPDDLRSKYLKSFFNIKEEKEKFEIIEKYQNITDENEKTKFFEQLEYEYIDRYYWAFTEEFEKYSKEVLIQKVKNMNNAPYILRKKFNDRELFELLKQGKINNMDISEECILNFTEDEIKEILKLNKNHNYRYVHPIEYAFLNGNVGSSLEDNLVIISEEKQKRLKTIVIDYLASGDENSKKELEFLIKNYEDFKYTIEKFPEIKEYIKYEYFNIDELIKLNEFLSGDLKYNLYLINRLRGEEFKELRIEKLSSLLNNNLDDIKNQKNVFSNFSKKDLISLYSSLENDDARIFLLSQYERYANINNFNEIVTFFEQFNEDKDYFIKLYQSLRNEKGEIDFSGSLNFLQKLETIKNNKEKILKLLEKNPNVLKTINYDMLDLFEDSNDEEFYTRYKSLQKIYVGERKDFYKKVINRLNDKLKNPEEFVQKCLDYFNFENEILHKIEETEDIDKMIFLLVERPELFKDGFQNYELIRDFEKNEEEYYKRTLENPNSTLENILDVYTRKFFNMTYFDAKSFVSQYEDGMLDLLKRYEEKDNLTIDEELEVSSLNRLRYLKEILNIKDIDALKECYESFANNPELSQRDYFENLICGENIRRAYTKEKKENLYVPNLSDKVDEIEYEGKKIDVLTPKGNFNILLTVIGAFVKNDAAKQNPKEEWNTNEKLNNHGICTSLIGNNNLSMAFRKGVPIFGFYNIGENSVYKEAEYDLGSNSEDIEINTGRQPKFRLTKKIINHVRLGHSETVLERRAENSNDETGKRQPDFIVAINKVDEVAKKAAKEFDVPIVLLNTKDIAKEESEKIINLQKEFVKNPTSEILQTIIEDYHNNYAGLITLDKKSCKKYFEPKKMEKNLIKIVNVIESLEDEKNKAELLEDFKAFIEEEEEKRRFGEKKYIPFSFEKVRERISLIPIKNVEETVPKKEIIVNNSKSINIDRAQKTLVKHKSKRDNALENVIEELSER